MSKIYKAVNGENKKEYAFVQFWPATKENKAYPLGNDWHLLAGIIADTNEPIVLYFNVQQCRFEFIKPSSAEEYASLFEQAFVDWSFDRAVHNKYARHLKGIEWTYYIK